MIYQKPTFTNNYKMQLPFQHLQKQDRFFKKLLEKVMGVVIYMQI